MQGGARTAAETGRQVQNGADPVEIVEDAIFRVRDCEPSVFLLHSFERARTEAKATWKRQRDGSLLGPLDGVPIAWKDLIDVAGSPTTCGSAILRNAAPANKDAACVANAARAGMVSIGKTNLTEFAFSGLGLNPHFGTPANPHDSEIKRIPGGSSAGSAVAVANHVVPCAIGTDTGGSVRVPAAFNGIAGFKTSTGEFRWRESLPSHPHSIRSVRCAGQSRIARCWTRRFVAHRGRQRKQWRSRTWHSSSPIIFRSIGWRTVLRRTSSGPFESCRMRVLESSADMPNFLIPTGPRVATTECSRRTKQARTGHTSCKVPKPNGWTSGCAAECSPVPMSGERLDEVLSTRQGHIGEFDRELGDRFLLTPTSATVAPELAPLDADSEVYRRVNLRVLRITMSTNYFRACGLSLPNGTSEGGLPTGALISARWGEDDRLLAAGLAIERILKDPAADGQLP